MTLGSILRRALAAHGDEMERWLGLWASGKALGSVVRVEA